jgi:hypothetical protein
MMSGMRLGGGCWGFVTDVSAEKNQHNRSQHQKVLDENKWRLEFQMNRATRDLLRLVSMFDATNSNSD